MTNELVKEFNQRLPHWDGNREKTLADMLIDDVIVFDYSYGFSDDYRAISAGERAEERIGQLMYACNSEGMDMEGLYMDCISNRREQYVDGLTHKTIKGWFSPYIGSEKNIEKDLAN